MILVYENYCLRQSVLTKLGGVDGEKSYKAVYTFKSAFLVFTKGKYILYILCILYIFYIIYNYAYILYICRKFSRKNTFIRLNIA